MKVQAETRFAVHPDHGRILDTNELRDQFLIEELFIDNTVRAVYSHHDRFIVGGVKPTHAGEVKLETFNDLKSSYFLERRELGIINVGGTGMVRADEKDFTLNNKEALYTVYRTRC
jgi:4-deoxy-L-threo-5-hexosulose-uronate ketol-isomerase